MKTLRLTCSAPIVVAIRLPHFAPARSGWGMICVTIRLHNIQIPANTEYTGRGDTAERELSKDCPRLLNSLECMSFKPTEAVMADTTVSRTTGEAVVVGLGEDGSTELAIVGGKGASCNGRCRSARAICW